MKKTETNRFNKLYQRHLRSLKLQGKSQKTIEAYSRAVRRITEHFDCCPDKLSLEQREQYFADLVKSHSWSTVKIDRIGLQFFWKHVLKQNWQWVDIVKAPKVRSLPDILTIAEVEQLIWGDPQIALPGFSAGHLLHGAAPVRGPGFAGGRYRRSAQASSYPARKRPQGSFRPSAGSDLSGTAYLVAQTSKSLLVVSKCHGISRAYSKSHHAHGSRRHSGGHESRGRQVRH
jgi:hypothetical protein